MQVEHYFTPLFKPTSKNLAYVDAGKKIEDLALPAKQNSYGEPIYSLLVVPAYSILF